MNKVPLPGIDTLLAPGDPLGLGRHHFALISASNVVHAQNRPVFLSLQERFPRGFREIWSLQHGFYVDKQDNMILSDSFFDDRLQIPIKSYYGQNLVPDPDDTRDLDLLIVDIFDVGCRVYTFLNHVVKILQALSGTGIRVVIADRPNPLGGMIREGNCASSEFFSLVGMADVPMRHGLSAGEYIRYAAATHEIDLPLEVIQAYGWKRKDAFQGIWTYPSPNMPRWRTALLYPGAVMLEGTNLSEGRGTTRPFEIFGAPYLDNDRLCRDLNRQNYPGAEFIPVFFQPEFSKYNREICRGLLLHITDPVKLRSFHLFYEVLRTVCTEYPDQFAFSTEPYEFQYDRPAIDLICGSSLIRKSLVQNRPWGEISQNIARDIRRFEEEVTPFLLY